MNVLEQALQVIKQEADAINFLYQHPPERLNEVIHLLSACRGRIIVSGVGKSAIIGQKITATFNSTGTPSIFLHAADALHGDIGMVQEEDCVLLLSKSGDTDELKALVPVLKNMGNTVIALTCNEASYLSSQCHTNFTNVPYIFLVDVKPTINDNEQNLKKKTYITSLQNWNEHCTNSSHP